MYFSKQVGVSSLFTGKSKKTGNSFHKIELADAQNYKSISLFLSDELMEKAKRLEITEGDLIEITINIRPSENFSFKVDLIDFEPVSISL